MNNEESGYFSVSSGKHLYDIKVWYIVFSQIQDHYELNR